MKIVVLGGAGLQGRAALQDLGRNEAVTKIVCADMAFEALDEFSDYLAMEKIVKQKVDATSQENLAEIFSDNVDAVIDLLPVRFNETSARAAIETGVPLVNSSYASGLSEEVFRKAKEKRVAIMPESGLDPGIDLVLCGYAVSQLDEVYELYSYCGGVPEPEAANNPIKYKISWNFDMVLRTLKRPSRMKIDGELVDIPAQDQHNSEWIKEISVAGVEGLESMPNGDAVKFAKLLGIADEVVTTERRTIRWKGHAKFWRDMVGLGFLEEEAVPGFQGISPHDFLVKHLEPRLQYKGNEKDLTIMKNVIRGKKDGKKMEIIYELIDERDLESGLFAMNRTVGYTASIVAQMLADGTIEKKGVLSPTIDIPYQKFIEEVSERGIKINEIIKVK
ncbi:saccharopine dehydrogenase C-terminal domain-containing protein [Virgibacillus sp. YIM 98842]|uniref:saccharopine dehydrogenase family protein n=1 Tax=Virgibacillus sp. YIM 98842 TaxID=2663533 RepID=UPI0013DD22C6|nr:saccharopine dehydrogenase C-terminal domain-containing protein [Virgibacillus sp. YIM 98842]